MTDRAQDTEAIRAALASGRQDAKLLDNREFDPKPWNAAEAELARLVARLEAAERVLADIEAELRFRATETNEVGQIDPPYTAKSLLSMADEIRALAAAAPGETPPTCICTRFRDLPEGTIIADLTCPVHGVNGTDPGDVLPDECDRG